MIGALALLSALTIAQVRDAPKPPPRDNAARAAGTGSIAGTIVSDERQPKPIRRAVVSLNCSDNKIGITTVTDDAGRFAFKGLPAGRYSVDANKRGWVSLIYGAKAPFLPGTSIPLVDGQRMTMTFRLPRTAAIAGSVLDEQGQVPPSVSLRLLRYGYVGGERKLVGAASSTISGPDERGQYRIWGIAPGEYYVIATAGREIFTPGSALHLTTDVDVQQALLAVQAGPAVPAVDVPERTVGVAPLYYPGTTSVSQATLIAVRPGEERTGVDFVTRYVTTSRIDGTVAGVDGAPVPPGTQVNLVNTDPNGSVLGIDSLHVSRTDATGKFSFAGIAPGAYTIVAQTAKPAAWASSDLDVEGDDIHGLALNLQDCLTVSGVVQFDGGSPPPPMTSVRAQLQPIPGSVTMSVSTSTANNVDANGRFSIGGITPGRYRLTAFVNGPRVTWLAVSSSLGGQETFDTPLDVRSSLTDGVIRLTDRLAELSGHAPQDRSIALFLHEPEPVVPGIAASRDGPRCGRRYVRLPKSAGRRILCVSRRRRRAGPDVRSVVPSAAHGNGRKSRDG